MKTVLHKMILGILALGLVSCSVETVVVDTATPVQGTNLRGLLESYELWYIDIDATTGSGEVPFLQRAFTMSFVGGTYYANNNIAGVGSAGNGFGIDAGTYTAFNNGTLDIVHDLDGYTTFDVIQRNGNRIELYNPQTNTSYYAIGYQRNNFNYDQLFYDNIEYLLQEYGVWEKVFTSQEGALNDFDDENYLAFYPGNTGFEFSSSQDAIGIPLNQIFYDYDGLYEIYNVSGEPYTKRLVLDYDYFGDDYFTLTVVDDDQIDLHHDASGTTYSFDGRGLMLLKNGSARSGKSKDTLSRKRRKHVEKEMKP